MRINIALYVFFVLQFLTGCDSPSMGFQGIEPVMITMDGSEFSVRTTPYDAEAIRLNFEAGATRRSILPKGVKAIEKASGCKIVPETLRGDANVIASDLACEGVPPRIIPKRAPMLECSAYEVHTIGDYEDYEIDCTIVE